MNGVNATSAGPGLPPQLSQLAGETALALFLDFDGTLVELAATPDGIAVPPGMARLLEGLADRLGGRLALVSGRSLENLAGHVGQIGLHRAGSHGAELRDPADRLLGEEPPPIPGLVVTELEAFAARHEGALLERKSTGAALHFRANPALEPKALAEAERLARQTGLALKPGNRVVELVSAGIDKGRAVAAFMARPPFAGSRPVFIGDDLTDEDGFAAVEHHGGFGIVVGDRLPTRARYRIPDVEGVYQWLML